MALIPKTPYLGFLFGLSMISGINENQIKTNIPEGLDFGKITIKKGLSGQFIKLFI